MGSRRRGATGGLLVFALAFLAIEAWRLRYSTEAALVNDAGLYYNAAQAIVSGSQGPLLDAGGHGAFLDVAYPNLLALWFRLTGVSVPAAQALNAVLWGLSCLFMSLAARNWLTSAGATLFGCLAALSPMLTSFGPKVYSEHAAIAGGTLALWSWYALRKAETRSRRLLAALAFTAGVALLVLTKSVFFPFLAVLVATAAVRRRFTLAVLLALAFVAIWPVHAEVERGGRGRWVVIGQAGRLELWPTSVALRCAPYALSWNLGLRIFPEVEGACEPWTPTPRMPMAELSVASWIPERWQRGFGYGDALRAIARRPFKYALLCGINLLGAAWIDGVYPAAVGGLGDVVRVPLWIFKVVLSTARWVLSLRAIAWSWRRRELSLPLLVPLAYVLVVHMNFLGEQRYYFPLLPLLYLLTSQWYASRKARLVPEQVQP